MKKVTDTNDAEAKRKVQVLRKSTGHLGSGIGNAIIANKEKAIILRKITCELSVWKESGPEGPEHSEEARKSAEKAMKILGSSADLLHDCKETFGVKYRQAESSLKSLSGILDYMRDNKEAPESITERIGYYDYQDFAQEAFIDQLNHWAEELEANHLGETLDIPSEKSEEKEKQNSSRSQSIQELIAKGESHTLEFKETFQYNIETKQVDPDVRYESLKTIAGFLNADGGTLLIGISDDGKVKGIAKDKRTMNKANDDRFELTIRNHITGKNSKFEPSAYGNVKFKFEELQGKTICIIDVQPLPKSDILHFGEDVYIRDGNNTPKLTGPSLARWILQRKLERKTTPKTPKADESTQNGVTTQDIEELLKLFRQLKKLVNPALPTKDDSLWREARKEAQKELSGQLRERSSKFTHPPGRYVPPKKATKAEQRKLQEQVENRIAKLAEKNYCEKDQAYLEAVDAAKKTTADVLKRIDHLLECCGGALQRFRRTKDTWLVEDFKEIRKLYDRVDKDEIKYSLRETIDALEALKLKLDRH